MKRILLYVRERLREVREAKPSNYRQGRIDAYEDVQDHILDLLWEEGEEG